MSPARLGCTVPTAKLIAALTWRLVRSHGKSAPSLSFWVVGKIERFIGWVLPPLATGDVEETSKHGLEDASPTSLGCGFACQSYQSAEAHGRSVHQLRSNSRTVQSPGTAPHSLVATEPCEAKSGADSPVTLCSASGLSLNPALPLARVFLLKARAHKEQRQDGSDLGKYQSRRS